MNAIFLSSLHSPNFTISRYIGPYQLSYWLRKHGYSCQVIDFVMPTYPQQLEEERLFRLIKKFIKDDTLMLGVSSTFFSEKKFSTGINNCLMRVRKEFPNVKLILGGNLADEFHPSITSMFDCAVIGFAEDILLELLNFYKTGTGEPKGIRELPHKIKFYRQPSEIKFKIEECDFRWGDDDCIQPGETLPLELSRGCIFKCKFCQYPLLGRTKNDYTRSMALVREELIDNYNRFGTTNYFLLDDTFNETVEKVRAFHAMTKSLPFDIKYCAYVRADLIHRFPEMISLLKDSGLKGAYFGIESLHPAMSKLVGKGWSGKHAKEFIPKLIKEHWNNEIICFVSMIVGLANKKGEYETFEELLESKRWLMEHRIPHKFAPLGIVRDRKDFSSEFIKNSEAYGYYHPEGARDGLWKHRSSPWTRELAASKSIELNMHPGALKQSGWGALAWLSIGYEWQQVLEFMFTGAHKKDFMQLELKYKTDAWLERYFQTLENKKDS